MVKTLTINIQPIAVGSCRFIAFYNAIAATPQKRPRGRFPDLETLPETGRCLQDDNSLIGLAGAPFWQSKTSSLSGAPFVVSDCTFWCFICDLWLDLLVLRFGTTSGPSGAPFVVSDCKLLSDWTCWCSVLVKPLVSLVLLLWSLIVLSGASFVLSDWTCWCPVLAKPLVSLVLLLWSLIYFLVLHLCSLIGLAGALFWQNLWSLWCSFFVFFAKRTRRQGQPKLANFAMDRLSPKGVFRHLFVWSFLVPLLVLRLWPLLVLFFGCLLCTVASINVKLCPIYWHEFRV